MTNMIDAHQLRRRLEHFDTPSIDGITDRLPSGSDLPSLRSLPGASMLSDVHFSDFEVPDFSGVADSLSDAADSVRDAAAVAGRRTSRLAGRTGRLGLRWGASGARAVGRSARVTGRAAGRSARSTARTARANPKVTLGVVLAIVSVFAAVTIIRKRRDSTSETDHHLAAVA